MNMLKATILALVLFSVACGDDEGETSISPSGFDRVTAARFNPAGSRLAMVGEKGEDAALLTTDDAGENVKTLVPTGLDYLSTVAWTSDGASIIYSGDGGIYRVPADGSGEPSLVVDAFAVNRLDLSPDDTKIVYSINGSTGIEVVDISGDAPYTAMTTGLSGQAPRFSPSGDKLVYISDETYKITDADFMNETDGPAGADYLANAAWVNDTTLLYLGNDEIRTWSDGSSETVREAFAGMDLDYNAATGRYIYGVNGQNGLTMANY